MRVGKLKKSLIKITLNPTGLYWDDSYRSDDVNSTTAYTQNYDYDLMGNLNELQHIGDSNFTRIYYHTNNLLDAFEVDGQTYHYQYDVCGNQIQENEERHMQWDYADKLRLYYNQTSLGTEPSVYTHYLYDAGGNRVKKYTRTAGGHWETITYIDGLIEYRENDNSDYQSLSHVMDNSSRIATIREGSDFGDTTPAIKYNLDDHLGSSNVLVDENGTLVNTEEYYPFGETSFGAYSKKRYRFCGKEKDSESGMYYYGARYYSPWLCRFISVDPKAGKYVFQTPYAYADNNPINKMDYNGEGTGENGQPANGGVQPSQSQSSGTTAPVHQVKKNETLGGIAKQYGTTVDALRKANNLEPKNDTKLQIGTKLNIPQGANQSGVKSNFNFSFNTITADNARSFMPTPLGLKAPKLGSSGGFSGQFMRTVMGNTHGEHSGSHSEAQTGLPGGVVQIGGTLAGFNLSFLGGFSQIDGFNGGISYGGDLNWDDWGVGLTIMGSDRLFKWDDVKGLGTTASIGYSVASYTESFSGLPTLENRNQSIYLFQGVTWGLGTRFGASLSVTKTKLVR